MAKPTQDRPTPQIARTSRTSAPKSDTPIPQVIRSDAPSVYRSDKLLPQPSGFKSDKLTLPGEGGPGSVVPTFKIQHGYLTFQGVGFTSHEARQFDVLCGDNPPTITGGYAKWQTIDRPLMRGITVFQGYDSVQMTCDVRFGKWAADGWKTTVAAGKAIEYDIGSLEWMGGSLFHLGPSPAVYVNSYSNQGGQATPQGPQDDLVPPQYRGLPWVVSGLTWGKSLRNKQGYRVYQEATVILTNYLSIPGEPRAHPRKQKELGEYVTVDLSHDTALRIAGWTQKVASPHADWTILARRIISDPKNNPCKGTHIKLAHKGVHGKIPVGTKVWVPPHHR